MHDHLQSKACAKFLKALADADRLKIIQCLQTGPKNVSELAEMLEEARVNVSHHLAVLRHAGLVQDAKQGKFVVYSLPPSIFRPSTNSEQADFLDLGCCRLELSKS